MRAPHQMFSVLNIYVVEQVIKVICNATIKVFYDIFEEYTDEGNR